MNYFNLLCDIRENNRNKNFLIIDERVYNYNYIYKEIDNIQGILKNSIKFDGYNILIFSKSFYFQVISFFVSNALNNIPIICHHSLSYKLLKEIISKNNINYVISDEKLELNEEEIVKDLSEEIKHIYVYKFNSKDKILNHKNICFGAFTSGSTNTPKVLYRSYESWTDYFYTQNNIFKIDLKSILFMNGSLSFTGNLNTLLSVLYEGGTIVTIETLSPRRWIKSMKDNFVTNIYIIPSKLKLLSQVVEEEISNIKSIFAGSELLFNDIAHNLKNNFPKSEIILYYGASELSFITYITYEEMNLKPLSVGRPFPGIKVFIKEDCIYVDTKYHVFGVEVPCTVNDMGYIDKDGYLFLQGRKEDIINKNGIKISFLKIEQEIKKIKEIIECAAVSYDNSLKGNEIAVFIITDEDINKEDILNKLKNKLMPVEIPKKVFFVKSLPLNDSGKIDKKKLKDI